MSEREPELEFAAPDYTILEKVREGLMVITRVVMYGEVAEFETPFEKSKPTAK